MEPALSEVQRALAILNDAAAAGKDFVWEQAPLVAKEVVYWTMASSVVGAVFWWALFIAAAVALVVTVKLSRTHWEAISDNYVEPLPIIICFVLIGVQFCVFLPQAYFSTLTAVKAAVAPRLVIIDYVSEKVRR